MNRPRLKQYGNTPDVIGTFPIEFTESCRYLYMLISLAGEMNWYCYLPDRLDPLYPLIEAVQMDNPTRFCNENVYLTVKHQFVAPGMSANRPGWHSDGFGTDDLNYIWCDALPTVFNTSHFELSPNHDVSLVEMERQAHPALNMTYPVNTLLKLDQYVIHRVQEVTEPMWRTFVKISISPEQYNLKGNTRNHAMKYDWPMYDRAATRNHPVK